MRLRLFKWRMIERQSNNLRIPDVQHVFHTGISTAVEPDMTLSDLIQEGLAPYEYVVGYNWDPHIEDLEDSLYLRILNEESGQTEIYVFKVTLADHDKLWIWLLKEHRRYTIAHWYPLVTILEVDLESIGQLDSRHRQVLGLNAVAKRISERKKQLVGVLLLLLSLFYRSRMIGALLRLIRRISK